MLGLGIMGAGMARRLLGAGFPLTVYNRTAAKAEALVADGARLAHTPREAARDADVIVSMVADDNASRSLFAGENGALDALQSGAIVIESSTVSPEWIAELAKIAQAKGVEVLDAPVTGSRPQAAAGELKFLVGGSDAALERARPVLAVMSKSIVHVGPTGSGATLKLINNFLCGVQVIALAEGVAWMEKAGLNPDTAMQVLTDGAAGSPLVKGLSARMLSRDYTPQFHLELMRKDLDYSAKAAGRAGVELTTAAAARARFDRAIEAGLGQQDFSSVVETMRS